MNIMNIRQDYSFLFSNTNGSNQNNIFYGINLADYATIKSGSYAKLLRSYYREMASGTDNHNNKVDKDKSLEKSFPSTLRKNLKVKKISNIFQKK